jgi:hypothetical protein
MRTAACRNTRKLKIVGKAEENSPALVIIVSFIGIKGSDGSISVGW